MGLAKEQPWVCLRLSCWMMKFLALPLRGPVHPASLEHQMEVRRLLLHRYSNRLPNSVPWVSSRECSVGRTDIVVIDPAWNPDLAESAPLIHTVTSAAIARAAPRSVHRRKPIEVTVLLGDDVMNSELNRIGSGDIAIAAMLCFAELPADLGVARGRTGSTYLGGLAFARETVAHQAQRKQLSVARHLASLAIHGMLVLLGFGEGDAIHTRLADLIEAEVSSHGAAGTGGDRSHCSVNR